MAVDKEPKLPIPISYVGSSYLLFDINAATWLRRVHHVCGLTTGTLPQSVSQNIFLGMPIHLMPEEAQLLVERGVCYVVDDVSAHEDVLATSQACAPPTAASDTRHLAYIKLLRDQGDEMTRARDEERERMRQQKQPNVQASARPKPKVKPKTKAESSEQISPHSTLMTKGEIKPNSNITDDNDAKDFVRDTQPTTTKTTMTTTITTNETTNKKPPPNQPRKPPPHGIAPTTSDLWLPESLPSMSFPILLPHVPPTSYPLYRHLNARGYYMTPGLRFGCQYSVYPGDPLRFHSHFLAVAKAWDEPVDLMTLVGGGRLGTGVKKGFLIGGVQPDKEEHEEHEEREVREIRGGGDGGGQVTSKGDRAGGNTNRNGDVGAIEAEREVAQRVRTFSFEWAYM